MGHQGFEWEEAMKMDKHRIGPPEVGSAPAVPPERGVGYPERAHRPRGSVTLGASGVGSRLW